MAIQPGSLMAPLLKLALVRRVVLRPTTYSNLSQAPLPSESNSSKTVIMKQAVSFTLKIESRVKRSVGRTPAR